MYTKTLALTGAFAVLVSAVPMAKRDVVWVTKVEEDVVTVPVTTTVWVDPTSAPEHFGHHGGNHGSHKKQTTVHSTVNVYPSAAPAPSSEAAPSPYSAPPASAAPSSEAVPAPASQESSSPAPAPSSVYVAPTTSSSVYVAPTSSPSAYVAPTTSSSVYVAPTTSAAPASTSAAAPASYGGSDSGSSSGSGLSYGMAKAGTDYSGDFTYFTPGTGACGHISHREDHMVAMSHEIFDSYAAEAGSDPNNNPICGKTVNLMGKDGTTYPATVWDRCPGCEVGALDLPEPFFDTVTSNGDGRVHNMEWSFA